MTVKLYGPYSRPPDQDISKPRSHCSAIPEMVNVKSSDVEFWLAVYKQSVLLDTKTRTISDDPPVPVPSASDIMITYDVPALSCTLIWDELSGLGREGRAHRVPTEIFRIRAVRDIIEEWLSVDRSERSFLITAIDHLTTHMMAAVNGGVPYAQVRS